MRSDESWLTFSYTRSKFPPWGLAGGHKGTPNYITIVRKDGSEERLAAATELKLYTDDVIRIHTGNGAGHGPPTERPRELVLADLRDQYISVHDAVHVYGQQVD